jgi:hypothetical protein
MSIWRFPGNHLECRRPGTSCPERANPANSKRPDSVMFERFQVVFDIRFFEVSIILPIIETPIWLHTLKQNLKKYI